MHPHTPPESCTSLAVRNVAPRGIAARGAVIELARDALRSMVSRRVSRPVCRHGHLVGDVSATRRASSTALPLLHGGRGFRGTCSKVRGWSRCDALVGNFEMTSPCQPEPHPWWAQLSLPRQPSYRPRSATSQGTGPVRHRAKRNAAGMPLGAQHGQG
eukprot:scaffold223969_cov30-Tisochrysis_lutea.AAC.12